MFVVTTILIYVVIILTIIMGFVWYISIRTHKDHKITTVKFHDDITSNKMKINDIILDHEEQDDMNDIPNQLITINTNVQLNKESIDSLRGYIDDKIKELRDELKKVPETKYYQQNELFTL